MRTIIEKTSQRIEDNSDVFISQGLSMPDTIDVYMGQPLAPDQFEFGLPAIFIDYMADYKNETLYVYLHVLQNYSEDTENYAPDRVRGMCYNDFLTTIKCLLNGLRIGKTFGVLKLHQETPEQTNDFYYHKITFSCSIKTDLYAISERYIDTSPVAASVHAGRLKDHSPM